MKSKVIALTLATLLGTTLFGGVQAQGATETSKTTTCIKAEATENFSESFRKLCMNSFYRQGNSCRPNIYWFLCGQGNGNNNEITPPGNNGTEVVPPAEDGTEIIPPSNGGNTEIIPPSNNDDTEVTPPEVGDDTEITPPESNEGTEVTPPESNEGGTNTTPDTGDVEDNVAGDNYMAQVEQAIFTKVNEERVKAGLSPLSYNTTMEKYARIKSQDMGDKNYFSHEDLNGNLITVKMQNDGVSYRAWGENIAYIGGITDPNVLAQQFMTNWMNSSGHRANILSTNFESIGVGVYKIGNKVYATQEFYK